MNVFSKISSGVFDDKMTFSDFFESYWWIFVIAIILVPIFCVIFRTVYIDLNRKLVERKKSREESLVDFNGQKVSQKQLCTIRLEGEQTIVQLKGCVFFAPVVNREGHIFKGWFYDSACTRPYLNTKVKSDIVLYPLWIKGN